MGNMTLIRILFKISYVIWILLICLCTCIFTRSESKNAPSLSSVNEDTSPSLSKSKKYDTEQSSKNIILERDHSLRAKLIENPLEGPTSISQLSNVVWANFVQLPRDRNYTEEQSLDLNVSKSFRLCTRQTVTNLSEKLGGADFDWCKWSLREDIGGGKVKVLSHPQPVINLIVDLLIVN